MMISPEKTMASWKFSSQIVTLLIFFTMILILVGSCIRMTNSGLSCPDWPLCYGLWLPTYSKISLLPHIDYGFDQVLFEWTHRFLAGFLIGGLMLLFLAHLLLQSFRGLGDSSILFSFSIAILLILAQVLFGSFTVFEQNSSWTVALHLLTAVLYLLVLWSLQVQLERKTTQVPSSLPVPFSILALSFLSVLLIVLIMSVGAMMAKSGASLVCPSWPFCNDPIPSFFEEKLLFLQMTHRMLSFFFLCNAVLLFRKIQQSKACIHLSTLSRWLLGITLFEVLLGGVLILFAIPFGLNVLHLVLSFALLCLSSRLYWKSVFSKE